MTSWHNSCIIKNIRVTIFYQENKMYSPQLIKHRVCFAFFAFGLCLAAIHGTCGEFKLNQSNEATTNFVEVVEIKSFILKNDFTFDMTFGS